MKNPVNEEKFIAEVDERGKILIPLALRTFYTINAGDWFEVTIRSRGKPE